MKHPALERKLATYRYDRLYVRYAWRITAVALLVAAHFLLLIYIAFGDVLSAALMGVFTCVGVLLSVAVGDHFGSEMARARQRRGDEAPGKPSPPID